MKLSACESSSKLPWSEQLKLFKAMTIIKDSIASNKIPESKISKALSIIGRIKNIIAIVNMGIIRIYQKRYHDKNDDGFAHVMVDYTKAINDFDYRRGLKFSTMCSRYIINGFNRNCEIIALRNKLHVSMTDFSDHHDATLDSFETKDAMLNEKFAKLLVDELMNNELISDFDKDIVKQRFFEDKGLDQIAKDSKTKQSRELTRLMILRALNRFKGVANGTIKNYGTILNKMHFITLANFMYDAGLKNKSLSMIDDRINDMIENNQVRDVDETIRKAVNMDLNTAIESAIAVAASPIKNKLTNYSRLINKIRNREMV